MRRPYLKCGLNFHWHIPSEEVSSRIVNELADFFRSNGFVRKRRPPTWNPKSRRRNVSSIDMSGKESCEEEVASANVKVQRNEEDRSTVQNRALHSGSRRTRSSDWKPVMVTFENIAGGIECFWRPSTPFGILPFHGLGVTVRNATVGMRSVLRAMQDGRISMVFLDAAFLRPSAVGTAFALYALRQEFSCSGVRVYSLQGLDATLSKVLNVRTVGAVGLREDEQTNPISSIALSELLPVERISSRKSGAGVSLATAQLTIPSGRRENKNQKEKKRKKKNKLKLENATDLSGPN
uniref:STAS domain-containing protein n=1 Tax=Ascaris lumbricoides TaxID=6252 RepID=A0A0M3HNT8_ASCLU